MVIKYEQFIFKNPWALLKEIGLNLRWSKVCLAWYDYLLDQRMLDNIRLHDFLKLASSIFKFNYKCTFHLVIKWQTIEYDWKKWNKALRKFWHLDRERDNTRCPFLTLYLLLLQEIFTQRAYCVLKSIFFPDICDFLDLFSCLGSVSLCISA